jgi:5-hydroxyisourate hydrolase
MEMKMGRLTTHVLDTTSGKPAAGVTIHLYCAGMLLAATVTNADGRCDEPLLDGDSVVSGVYDLVFGIGDYFGLPEPRFLDEVVVRFTVGDTEQHYHVPLIATPWSYTTYRGS